MSYRFSSYSNYYKYSANQTSCCSNVGPPGSDGPPGSTGPTGMGITGPAGPPGGCIP